MRGPRYYLFLTALKNGIKFNAIDKTFQQCENLRRKFSPDRTNHQRKKRKDFRKEKDANTVDKNAENEEEEEGCDDAEELKDHYVLSHTTQSRILEADKGDSGSADTSFEPFEEVCYTLNGFIVIMSDLFIFFIDGKYGFISLYRPDRYGYFNTNV